jgi:hypothetical protein
MAQDIIFAIDQVETLNSNDPEGMFTGRFDPDGVGVVGHSLGAAAAVVAGPMDDRILAVINEDGIILPYTYPRVEQPFMYFSAGEPRFEFDGVNYTVIVLEFHHLSFTDLVLFVPGFGSVSPARSVEIARAYVLAFFDEYVKGIEQPLLDGSFDDFPEVDVTINSTD